MRRTVLLHEDCEEVIRMVQKTLIDNGWTASFSIALNNIIAAYALVTIREGNPCQEISRRTRSRLENHKPNLTQEELQAVHRFLEKAKNTSVNRKRTPNGQPKY